MTDCPPDSNTTLLELILREVTIGPSNGASAAAKRVPRFSEGRETVNAMQYGGCKFNAAVRLRANNIGGLVLNGLRGVNR